MLKAYGERGGAIQLLKFFTHKDIRQFKNIMLAHSLHIIRNYE